MDIGTLWTAQDLSKAEASRLAPDEKRDFPPKTAARVTGATKVC